MAGPVLLDCDPGHDDAMIAAGRAQPLHGRLRAAAAIHGEPGLAGPASGEPAVTTVEANVAVEPTGTHTRGATVVDLHG